MWQTKGVKSMTLLNRPSLSRRQPWWCCCWWWWWWRHHGSFFDDHGAGVDGDIYRRWKRTKMIGDNLSMKSFSASSYLFIFSLLSSCPLKAWYFPTFLSAETVALQRSAVQPPSSRSSNRSPATAMARGSWLSALVVTVAVVSLGRLTQLDFAGQLTRPASPKVVRQGGTSAFVMPFLPFFLGLKQLHKVTTSHNKSQKWTILAYELLGYDIINFPTSPKMIWVEYGRLIDN